MLLYSRTNSKNLLKVTVLPIFGAYGGGKSGHVRWTVSAGAASAAAAGCAGAPAGGPLDSESNYISVVLERTTKKVLAYVRVW